MHRAPYRNLGTTQICRIASSKIGKTFARESCPPKQIFIGLRPVLHSAKEKHPGNKILTEITEMRNADGETGHLVLHIYPLVHELQTVSRSESIMPTFSSTGSQCEKNSSSIFERIKPS